MPKKVKKGGGSKREGWTEEEKLLSKQQRALAEEELNKKKEETLTLFLKDKLQMEERNTTINLLKLNEAWRTILRQTRHAALRDDITVFSQTFEMRLDSVNSLIKCLVHDLEEAELWEGQTQDSHLHHVDCLQILQEKRLRILLQQWERGLRDVDFTLDKESQQISAVSEQQCAHLEDVTFELQRQQHEVEADLQHIPGVASQSSSKSHNKTQLHFEERHCYQTINGKRAIEKSSQTVVGEHREDVSSGVAECLIFFICGQIAEIQEQHEHNLGLTEVQDHEWISSEQQDKPNHIQNVSEGMDSDVKKLQDAICQRKKTLNISKRENKVAGADLRAAKDEVAQKTRKLQAEMTLSHKMARKQLTELTIHSSDAIKKLKGDIAEGERILRLAKMCSKRESELKKVLPSCSSSLTTDHQSKIPTEEWATGVSSMYTEVEQIWQCYNTSVLQQEALRKQKEHLSHENQQLQVLLRQHLDAMTVSEPQICDQHHGPLLSVLQAPQKSVLIKAGPGRQQICHTVIEAVHVVKHA
ncbi:dynein regulatory complex subunit 2 [Genypterus blacodes]|uniref:dynein regulatory complex subunit 2 n=1 Tax=Genypterus blacodes TaxID=154954 RepID=UPI003F7726D5